MKIVLLIAMLLLAAATVFGQAVPLQDADVQLNTNSGPRGGNTIEVKYSLNNQGVNQSLEGYINFNLNVFPSNLSPAMIQKATLVLFAENPL